MKSRKIFLDGYVELSPKLFKAARTFDSFVIILKCFRHELARLKGMDRVVIPSEQYDRIFETYNWYCTKCDSEISVFENYCSNCGRRILWEKVK